MGKPVGKDKRHGHLGRRPVEAGRRDHLGLVLGRSRLNLIYYGTGNPGDLEPGRSAPATIGGR